MFLMYRVELKEVAEGVAFIEGLLQVPNVPCGVERLVFGLFALLFVLVPNVPCGVERNSQPKNQNK